VAFGREFHLTSFKQVMAKEIKLVIRNLRERKMINAIAILGIWVVRMAIGAASLT